MKEFVNNSPITGINMELLIKELSCITDIARDDFESKEAMDIAKELEDIIKDKPLPLNLGSKLKMVTRVDSLLYRTWLFEYKERGFLLYDIGNGYYKYSGTVEEYLLGVTQY